MISAIERGKPLDRHYIETLSRLGHSHDIAGRVLEIGDTSTPSASGARGSAGQVRSTAMRATAGVEYLGDLAGEHILPANAFDCIVLTQTLHLIFDMPAARRLHRALAPGGVLLVTVPGITPLERGVWGRMWCWSFTGVSARLLFGPLFGEENVAVEVQGNVLSATACLQGLAAEELTRARISIRSIRPTP